MNVRTVLLALPTAYLLIALLFMNGPRSPVLPRLPVGPARNLFYTEQNVQAPIQHTISNGVVNARAPAAPVAVEQPAVHVAAAADVPPEPKAPKGLDTITYYDNNSVKVYPFATAGSGSESWWANVARGWERDSLHAIKAMLLKR